MRAPLILVSMVVGCGGGSSTPSDGRIDGSPDAPPDVLIDAPPPPVGHHHYVLDALLVPTTNTQARDYGQDLDGDLTVDNQLGMVLATLSAQGLDSQAATTASIDRGTTISLVDLYATDFTTEPAATVAMFAGENPMPAACAGPTDTACRHHLAGTATFTVVASAPTNPPLTGAFVGGTLTTQPGHLSLPIVVFPGSMPVTVDLIGAKLELQAVTATGIGMAKIGGAVTQTEVDAKIYPAIAAGIEAQVAIDCSQLANPPTCGCTPSSTGKTELDLFDQVPKDCHVTVDEVRTNSLIQSLFAPDVMVEGMMALSVGVRATAVEAGFVAP